MSGLKFNYKEKEVYKIEKKLWQYSEAVVEWEEKNPMVLFIETSSEQGILTFLSPSWIFVADIIEEYYFNNWK